MSPFFVRVNRGAVFKGLDPALDRGVVLGFSQARGRSSGKVDGDLEGDIMDTLQLRSLKLMALLLLLPGLAGLLYSANISSQYLVHLPRTPVPEEMRVTPQNIHGFVVYGTDEERKRLSQVEFGSTGVFVLGMSVGFVYMQQWGVAYSESAEDEDLTEETA